MNSKRLLSMLIMAFLTPIVLKAQAPSPIVPYTETFESYNANANPANWAFSTNGIAIGSNQNVIWGVNTTNGLNDTKSFRMITPPRTTSEDPIYIIAKLPEFDYQANFLKIYFNSKFTSTGNNTRVILQVGYVLNNEFVQIGSNVPTSSSYGTEHHFSFNATSVPSNARIAFRQVSLSGANVLGTWDIDNVNVILDTRTPYPLTASNITNNSAYLSWDIVGNYSVFEVEYSTNSDFTSATNVPTNNNYLSLTDLAPGTTYYTRVRAKYIDKNHSGFTYGSWASKTFTTTCDAPTGLAVNPSNITETNIRVTWDDNLIKDVDLEYKPSNQTEWLTLGNAQNYNYYLMSVSGLNLQQGTLYQVRAKFPCSDWCEPVEFRTAFGGLNELMYTFENGMPADFTVTGAGAENVSVSTEQSFGGDEHSLKYSFVSGNPVPSPGTTTIVEVGTYLRTYSFNAFLVYFDMYCHDAHTYENVALQYDAWVTSGSGTWQDTWRTVATWSAFYSNQGWVEKAGTLSLPSELQGGVSKLRFRLVFTDQGSGENTYIDNIHIFPKGSCNYISGIDTYALGSTSATFHWNDPNYEAGATHSTGFIIRYRNMTIPTNTNTGWIEEFVYADNTNPQQQYTYMLTDLDPSSAYLLSIRTICPEGGYTEWSSPNHYFETQCQAYELKNMEPFTEDFDNIVLNPACWTYTTNWNRIYDGHGGHNWCLRSNYNPVAGWNDYIDTPEIELNSNYVNKSSNYLVLRFWTKCSGVDGTGNKVKVMVGDQVTEIYEMPSSGCDEWQLVHLSLSRFLPSTGSNTISVRFDHVDTATEWFIDDVVITSFDNASYGMRIFDDALSNDRDWTNDDNWYPHGAPTYSPSMNVTLMSQAWVPDNCESTVDTMRFGTQGYLDVQPGSDLTVTEVDIPENKVFVEPGATLHIGTAHFGFDKVFTNAEGTYNITNLIVDGQWLAFNNGTVLLGIVTLNAPGRIAVTHALNATMVNSSGMFEVYPNATVNIGTLTAAEASPFNVLLEGTANITDLNANGENSVLVRDGALLNVTGSISSVILSDNTTSLVIEDGGQVRCTSDFMATIQRNITGYSNYAGSLNGGYCLYATPLAVSATQVLVPTDADDEFLFDEVDVYWFNGIAADGLEWINAKAGLDYIHGLVTLSPTKGYLYARENDGVVTVSADNYNLFPKTDGEGSDIEINYLDCSPEIQLGDLNLIGNPYTCNAYVVDDEGMGVPFYRMNASGDAIVPADADNGGYAIKPCEGVFVKLDGFVSPLHFTTTAPASYGEAPLDCFAMPTHGLYDNQEAYGGAMQEFSLTEGWNWFAPTVGTSLGDLQDQLGSNVVIVTHDATSSGNIIPGQMLKIYVDEGGLFTLSGCATDAYITIEEGINWFGYTGAPNLTLSEALDGSVVPATGDKIISQDEGFAIYNGTVWEGTITTLVPGKGYVYYRNPSGN